MEYLGGGSALDLVISVCDLHKCVCVCVHVEGVYVNVHAGMSEGVHPF